MALSLGALFIFLFFFNVSAKVCVRVCGNVRFFNSLENMRDVWGDRSICSSKGLVLCDFFFFFCVRSFNCVQSTEVSWTAMLQKPEMEGDRCGHFSTIPGMRVFASAVDSQGFLPRSFLQEVVSGPSEAAFPRQHPLSACAELLPLPPLLHAHGFGVV